MASSPRDLYTLAGSSEPLDAAEVPPPPVSHSLLAPGSDPEGTEPGTRQRRTARRTRLFLGSTAAVIVTGLAAMAWPRAGQLGVNVSDGKGRPVERVQVLVDGKPGCHASPCVLAVAEGVHEVNVVAEGYDFAARTVAIRAGQASTAAFALVPSTRPTGLKLSGSPPGARLTVDGNLVGALPQELRDMAPGEHVLRVAASDRYQALERQVVVEPNTILDLGEVSLPLLPDDPAPPEVAPAPAPPPPAAPAATGEAYLNVNSIPSSTCYVDGEPVGTTPQIHVPVPPGPHVVKFVSAENGLTKIVGVLLAPGETKRAVARLGER